MTMDMNNQSAQAGQEGGQMQELMQTVQQMLEQGAQPTDVVMTLVNDYQMPPEAILQLFVQMGMPQDQAQQTIEAALAGGEQPQGSGEESMEGAQSNPEEEVAEQPEMKFGGPTKKDFLAISRDMIKTFRKGGEAEGLDTSNTQAYVENLKGAISNHLAKSNAVATVKKRTQENMALFQDMPTAKYGDEITDDQIKQIQKSDPSMTKEKFLSYDEDIRKSWLEPVKGPATIRGEEAKKTFSPDKNYRFVNGEFVEVPATTQETKTEPKTTTGEYNGVQANTQRSLSGKDLNTQQFLTSPLGQMLGAVGDKTPTGNIQVKGFGSLAGADRNELAKMLASGEYGVSSIEDVRRKGIFGREKRNDTDIFGRSNVIGKRVYFGQPGSGTSTPASLTTNPQNPTGFDSKSRNVDEYLQEMKISRADYDNNVGGVRDAVNKEFGITTPNAGTVHPNAGNINSGNVDPNDRWSQKQQRELDRDQRKNPEVKSTGYMPEYEEYLDRNEKEVSDFATQLGVSPEELKDPAIMNAVLDAMEGGTGKFYTSPNSPLKNEIENNRFNNVTSTPYKEPVAENSTSFVQPPSTTQGTGNKEGVWKDGDWFESEEDYNLISKKSGEVNNLVRNWAKQWNIPYDQASVKFAEEVGVVPKFSNRQDVENFDRIYGEYVKGFKKKMGGPVWDWRTMKFVNGGSIPLAKDGAETYINILPEYEREIDFASLAQGAYGAGDWLNNKLDVLRNRTPRNVATAQRSTDNMFDPAAPDSGSKGFYDEMGRFIPTDAGARVLAGTGTDQSVYGQFTNRNFYDEFMTNNIRKKNGGLVRASRGIQVGGEIDLNDDDLAAFQALGYKVKRIG